MDEQQMNELQDPSSWEFGKDEPKGTRPRKARAVVSVAFPREDFERVEDYAEQHQMKISEVIRLATLEHVLGKVSVTSARVALVSAGGSAQMTAYFQQMHPSTVAHAATIEMEMVPD